MKENSIGIFLSSVLIGLTAAGALYLMGETKVLSPLDYRYPVYWSFFYIAIALIVVFAIILLALIRKRSTLKEIYGGFTIDTVVSDESNKETLKEELSRSTFSTGFEEVPLADFPLPIGSDAEGLPSEPDKATGELNQTFTPQVLRTLEEIERLERKLDSINKTPLRLASAAVAIALTALIISLVTPGPQGEQGPRGLQGERGIQGEQGIAGKNGADGQDGVNGLNGSTGGLLGGSPCTYSSLQGGITCPGSLEVFRNRY